MTIGVRILLGLGAILLGIVMVYKTPWTLSVLGRVYFAEKNFGPGGTRLFIKLMGLVIILIGFVFMTNLFEPIIGGFFNRIFG